MPARGGPSNSPTPGAASLPIVFENDARVILAGATFTTDLLHAENLPGVNLWALQSVGPGVLNVRLQFANGQEVGGPGWQNIVPVYALVVGVETPFSTRLGSRLWRAQFTAVGGNCTLAGFRLTASLT